MSETSLRRNPVEELAEDFLKRYRRGERPSISEYARRHPDLADDILDLFPSLAMMEEAGAFSGSTAPISVPDRLGDYRILREVGRGGMGVVYEAVQESLGRHVALKVLPPESSRDRVRRFRHEACSAARLHHTNIVPVFEVGEHGGTNYYAMQFIQGQSLDEVMRELRRLRAERQTVTGETPARDEAAQPLSAEIARALTGRPLGNAAVAEPDTRGDSALNVSIGVLRPVESTRGEPPRASEEVACQDVRLPSCSSTDAMRKSPSSTSELTSQSDSHYYRSVARVGMQVAEALAYAHGQKVLHRDIKPSNLLLDLEGTAWVTDFGLAKEEGEGEDLTETGDLVGTLRFMAPERFRGNADARSDIYGLGLTLYELLALRPAFDEADRGRLIRQITQSPPARPRTIDRHVPRDMETIVLKAIAKEPAARYQTAGEVAEDLRRFLSDRPILARRSSALEQTWRWCRRNPLVAGLAALVVLLLATVATVSSVAAWRLNDEQVALRNQLVLTQKAEKIAGQRAEQIRLAAERQHTTDALIQSAGMLVNFGHWRAANQAFEQAILLRPDSSLARQQRGMFYGSLTLWDLAAAEFDDGFRLQAPDHGHYWLAQALLTAYVNDESGYCRHRDRLCERFRRSPDFFGQENAIVRAGTLRPCDGEMTKWLLEVAQQGVRNEPHVAYTHYSLGLVLYQRGDDAAALAAFGESLRVGGHWTKGCLAHMGIARCQHRLGRMGEARESLARASKVMDQVGASAVHLSPGRLLLNMWHDWLECLVRFRDVVLTIEGSPPPKDARLLVLRARALVAIDETEKAVVAGRQALALAPDHAEIRLACSQIMAGLGDEVEATTEPNSTSSGEGDRHNGLTALARFANRDEWDLALAEWRRLKELWPDDAQLHLACADTFLRHGRWTEAAAVYAGVVELSDDRIRLDDKYAALMGRARARARLGEHEQAIEDLAAAFECSSDSARQRSAILIERADQYRLAGDLKPAIADMDRALELDPDASSRHRATRGMLHAGIGHWNEALADFNVAIQGDRTDWWLRSWRGYIHREMKNWDKAIADLSRAIELNPRDSATFDNRGEAHAARQEWEEAVADFSRAVEIGRSDPEVYLRRARALTQLNRLSESVADYAKYSAASPDDAAAWFEAARVHAKLGALSESRQAYKRGVAVSEAISTRDTDSQSLRDQAERALADAERERPAAVTPLSGTEE